MKILVTGASGLLGLNLLRSASGAHEMVAADRGRLAPSVGRVFRADLAVAGAAMRLLDDARPDAVINCAALADVDRCEADAALAARMNSSLPAELASACAQRGLRLLQVSTDAVFGDSSDRWMVEEDIPQPLSVYAATKLEGERRVLESAPNSLVARVNFFGWSASGTRSLAEYFYNGLSKGSQVYGFTDVQFCPLHVTHLSEILLTLLEKGLSGLFHVVGPLSISKYDFAAKLAEEFGFSKGLLIPRSVDQAGLTAKRSHNLRLATSKVRAVLGESLASVEQGLALLHRQYEDGYSSQLRTALQPDLA